MDFTDVETAIKAQIRTHLPYVKVVETYAGQLEADIEALPTAFPAVLVVFKDSTYQWVDGRSFNNVPVFSVLVVAKDLRGPKDLRTGEYGCYRMIKDVLAALAGQTLGLDMWPMQPQRASLIFISKTMAAYGIDFSTNFDSVFIPA